VVERRVDRKEIDREREGMNGTEKEEEEEIQEREKGGGREREEQGGALPPLLYLGPYGLTTDCNTSSFQPMCRSTLGVMTIVW